MKAITIILCLLLMALIVSADRRSARTPQPVLDYYVPPPDTIRLAPGDTLDVPNWRDNDLIVICREKL